METKAMENKLRRYNVEQLGEIPVDREDGTMRILVCQMGGCASREAREIKIAAPRRNSYINTTSTCAFSWS
jgi:hypothetical protein